MISEISHSFHKFFPHSSDAYQDCQTFLIVPRSYAEDVIVSPQINNVALLYSLKEADLYTCNVCFSASSQTG